MLAGRDSIVDIATCYGLDGPGIEVLINPPYAPRIPAKLVHLRNFVFDMDYVPLLHQTKRVNISSGVYIMSYTCSQ